MAEPSIKNALECLQRLIDADTEYIVGTIEVLERTNINASTKYMNVEDRAKQLKQDTDNIKKHNEEIHRYEEKMDEIIRQVDEIEVLANEIDEWSKELQVKCRRLTRRASTTG